MSKNINNSEDLDTKDICAKYVNNEEGYDAEGYGCGRLRCRGLR
jgi:hypothetical protein